MSTRCQIGYYSSFTAEVPEILIYKHSDGYPSDTLVAIADFLKEFVPARGTDDAEYLMAQLLVALVNRQRASMAEYWSQHPDTKRVFEFLGFGICGDKNLHYDIEYLYKITPAGVQVYSVKYRELDGHVRGKSLLTARQAKAVLRGAVPKAIRES